MLAAALLWAARKWCGRQPRSASSEEQRAGENELRKGPLGGALLIAGVIALGSDPAYTFIKGPVVGRERLSVEALAG